MPALQVMDWFGCRDTSSKPLQVEDAKPNLGADTSICIMDTIQIGPGQAFASYSWSTGETDSAIQVTESDLYILTTTSFLGCVGKDSIFVAQKGPKDPDCQSVGVDFLIPPDALRVFPNPTLTQLTITWEHLHPGTYSLRLFSLLGHVKGTFKCEVASSGKGEYTIDLSGFPSGIYFLTMGNERGSVVTEKLIKH
jgi:hypothetical protein